MNDVENRILSYFQVLINSVQGFQRRSRKCLSQSKVEVANLVFRMARKTQTVKFRSFIMLL